MQLRSVWTGVISFGLVHVPVKAYSAARDHDLKSNQLHAKDGARIQFRRFCTLDGEELEFADLVKGYAAGERHVVLSSEDLTALAPDLAKGIAVDRFVDAGDIAPELYESSYLLAPEKGASNPYALLLAAMRDTGKVGVGRVLMRGRTYLATIRAAGEALTLSTLRYADELLRPGDVEALRELAPTLDAGQLAMARQLVEVLSGPFEHAVYRDDYRDALEALIEARAAMGPTMLPASANRSAKGPDIMAALEASIAAHKAPAPKAKRERKPRLQANPETAEVPKSPRRRTLKERLEAPVQAQLVAAGATSAGDLDA